MTYEWDTNLSDIDSDHRKKYKFWMSNAITVGRNEWDELSLAIECASHFDLEGPDWETPIYLIDLAEEVICD